jgi:hypothetical protein
MNIEIRAVIVFFTLKGLNRKPILSELPFGKDSAWLREDEEIPTRTKKEITLEKYRISILWSIDEKFSLLALPKGTNIRPIILLKQIFPICKIIFATSATEKHSKKFSCILTMRQLTILDNMLK